MCFIAFVKFSDLFIFILRYKLSVINSLLNLYSPLKDNFLHQNDLKLTCL